LTIDVKDEDKPSLDVGYNPGPLATVGYFKGRRKTFEKEKVNYSYLKKFSVFGQNNLLSVKSQYNPNRFAERTAS
jgi:hypothetical protein